MDSKRKVKQLSPSLNYGKEKGLVLLVALVLLSILTLIGTTAYVITSTEIKSAGNYKRSIVAFGIAEAGFERTKATLKQTTASNLNAFLTGTSPGPYPFGDTPGAGNSLNAGNYIVRIYDNNDDADPNNDTDNFVFVESTGYYTNSQKQIVALVQVPLVSTPDGAVEVISPDESEIVLEEGAVIDGNDWDPPADPSSCTSIASCGTLTSNPAIAGVSSNSADLDVDVEAPSTIDGNPATKVNPGLSTIRWDNLVNQLIPKAARNLSAAQSLTGTHTWGTLSAPEISVISGSDIEIEGEINGVGLLIIDNAGELQLDHGILNWQGLVIIRGAGELEVELEDDDDATLRLFGSLILTTSGSDSEVELEMVNANSFIKYSSSAISTVRSFFPMTVQSWREVSM